MASKKESTNGSAAKTAPKKLYIQKKSGIHNRGLFAKEDIPAGARIIEYVGERITKAEAQRRAAAWDEKARKKGDGFVYIFELKERYDIDGNVAYNPARLINHSCDPNCEAENIRGHIWIMATRPIAKGEELSYDYGYDMEHFLEHPCYCNTKKCIGYIVREDQRKRVKSLIQRAKKKQ